MDKENTKEINSALKLIPYFLLAISTMSGGFVYIYKDSTAYARDLLKEEKLLSKELLDKERMYFITKAKLEAKKRLIASDTLNTE